MDALVGSLLDVVPVQEANDDAQLREAIFGAMRASLTDNFVENARNVRRVFKAQISAEGQGSAARDEVRNFRMPDEQLLEADVSVVEEQRDGRYGEIQGVESRLEIDEPIAPGNLEKPVSQV